MAGKRTKSRNAKATALSAESFLRSINLQFDADAPERIQHFRPTAKSTRALFALGGETDERAFFLIAPYGTGKSLAATYLLHLIENRDDSRDVLRILSRRFADVSPEFADFATRRVRSKKKSGLVIALHGCAPSIPTALKTEALKALRRHRKGREAKSIERLSDDTIEDAIGLLSVIAEKAKSAGMDRILILWDEFGRHLESLVVEGRAAALLEIQQLAEFASRYTAMPITVGLILHQNVVSYAGSMPESVRREWRKIEGRFGSIQYVDDSVELLRLIAEIMTQRRPASMVTPTLSSLKAQAKCMRACGLFREVRTQTAIAELLGDCYPLEPTTLFLLPRVAARVAQNERTLFSYLYSLEIGEGSIGPDSLYHYFEPAIRSDTAVGGTYRQWLETQSAINKAPSEDAARAIRTACLLGFGTQGGRSKCDRAMLASAVTGYGDRGTAQRIVDELIDRRLLLYRKHSDEVSVWHGTDIDLRSRLEDEKSQMPDAFDLVSFLNQEAIPPIWRPVEHNDQYCIRRYFESAYHTLTDMQAEEFALRTTDLPVGCDGRVLYLIADQPIVESDIAAAFAGDERIITVIPVEPIPIRDAAIEVASLMRMQSDEEIVNADPLALDELRQMEDDARTHLRRLIDQLTSPNSDSTSWYHAGEQLDVSSRPELRRRLSQICDEIYKHTPRLSNEVLNRKRPTPVTVNARKKLVANMLEFAGEPDLSLYDESRQHEVSAAVFSIYRTLVQQTGLYGETRNGRWGYRPPSQIKDEGLKRIWTEIRAFLTEPQSPPKPLDQFLLRLQSPPYGLRAGVLPVLLAAGLRAFPTASALFRDNVYVEDLKPSEIEQMCREPERYRLRVLELKDSDTKYLRAVHRLFSAVMDYEISEPDLIRQCFEALEAWKAQLPSAAFGCQRVSELTDAIRRSMRRQQDPVRLLLNDIPELAKGASPTALRPIKALEAAKVEMESVIREYESRAITSLRHALGYGHDDRDLREIGRVWSETFGDDFVESLTDGFAKGFLSRLRQGFDSDAKLANSIAVSIDRSIDRWDDAAAGNFERKTRELVGRIDELAYQAACDASASEELKNGMANRARGRVSQLYEQLVWLIGNEAAADMLDEIAKKDKEGAHI